VIWSEGAAASALICDEANAARQQSKLIQVSADGRAPPAPFDRTPVAILSGWRGESGHPGWRQIISQLEMMSASGSGANAKRRIASAFRSFTFPSLVFPRRLRADAMLALPSPYNPARLRDSRRFEPATALFLVALMSAAAVAGWVGGRQQGIRDGAEMVAAAPADAGRLSLASANAGRGSTASGAAIPSTAIPPGPTVRTVAAASAALTAPGPAPTASAALVAAADFQPARSEPTRSEPMRSAAGTAANASQKTAREQRPAVKTKGPVRLRTAPKPKPPAKPKPARPRIKYRHSETMRLFCQGAGKATPECRIFRRNAPRKRR